MRDTSIEESSSRALRNADPVLSSGERWTVATYFRRVRSDSQARVCGAGTPAPLALSMLPEARFTQTNSNTNQRKKELHLAV